MPNKAIRFSIKDYGYTVIYRLESALRNDIACKLNQRHGDNWKNEIPSGIWSKYFERSGNDSKENCTSIVDFLDETDFPDNYEILTYRKNIQEYYPGLNSQDLRKITERIYPIRCQIAHFKSSFSQMDFELLLELSKELCLLLKIQDDELDDLLKKITEPNQDLLIKTPTSFICDYSLSDLCLNNLPDSDYGPDGGFIGRTQDVNKLTKLVKNNLDRIITIIGAGGVGKTALAHKVCDHFIYQERLYFDSVIWVSAKEEYLTASGIEKIEPIFHNYEGLLDSIIETYGLTDKTSSVLEKEQTVELIFQSNWKGILLVIDNLETIKDESVLEYIKDIPLPNKVLITSRLGLGEIERRMPLKELEEGDAVKLIRAISNEKGIDSLAKLSDKILKKYVSKMFRYPLAIKWTVGQVALGVDINFAVNKLSLATGDLVQFCFKYIFEESLNENDKVVLFSLSLYENPVGRGIISHVASLDGVAIDEAIRKLVVASLIIPIHEKNDEKQQIETKYDLLPLTRNFVQSELRKDNIQLRNLSERKNATEHLVSEGERAGNEYIYSLSSYGASSEEEKIAVTMIINAHRYYSQNKDYDKASNEYFKASQIAPDFAIIYRNWASFEAEFELFGRADDLMRQATRIAPKDPRLWFTWGNIEKKRQQYDSALKYFYKALELSPDDGAIYGMLGEIEKRLGNFKIAESHILKAIEIGQSQRDELRHEVVNKTVLADIYRRWSDETKDSDRKITEEKLLKALAVAQEAFDLDGNDQTAEFRLKEVALYLATFYQSEKKIPSAIEHFKKAISPQTRINKFMKLNVRAYYFLCWIAYEANEKKLAAKYFDEGKKYFSGHPIEKKFESIENLLKGKKEKGIIEKIIPGKAYGFIDSEDSRKKEIFFHMNNIESSVTLAEFERLTGNQVSFLCSEVMKNGRLQLEASFIELLGLPEGYKNGVLKRILPEKGYGFITSEETDYFIHHNNFNPPVSLAFFESLEGRMVAFIPKKDSHKEGFYHAVNVRLR